MYTETKHCMLCDKALKGRADKKFCDDYCRNQFNNQLKAKEVNRVRNVINALRKNRLILQRLLGDVKRHRIPRERLLESGFQFKYCTHVQQNPKGHTCHFCFEYGYMDVDREWMLLMKSA